MIKIRSIKKLSGAYITLCVIITAYSQPGFTHERSFAFSLAVNYTLPEKASGTFQMHEAAGNSSDSANPYALVAGGSKGIGYAIAESLAKRRFNLILIARHLDSLMAAKEKLESAYNIVVQVLTYDLSDEESAEEIARWCIEKDIHLKMLCNVAGFG